MVNIETPINTPISIPFTSVNLVTGLTGFAYVVALNNVVLSTLTTPVAPTFTFVEMGGGAYLLTFTPSSTGNYTIYIQNQIAAVISVVARDKFSYLQNLENEAIGSWSWNKTTGVLTMLRQDGTTLATYNVVDNLTIASRARV
jgi:hypothetical protein